jgi:DNA-binding GntR family transcriptional regulator
MPALDRRTLADSAREALEREILDGGLKAGDKLNEVALSGQFGVSRGTVREAIRALSQSGLIELIANRGAFVKKVSVDDVANLYDLRKIIFALGCEKAALNVAQEQAGQLIKNLEGNIKKMRRAKANDAAGYYALNIEFHELLMSAAGNPHAQAAYEDCVRKMHLFRRYGLAKSESRSESIAEHEQILDAVRAGDPELSSAAGGNHVDSGKRRFMARFVLNQDQN